LWGLPPTVLLIGIAMIAVVVRRRRAAPKLEEPANLTAAEEARLSELLREGS